MPVKPNSQPRTQPAKQNGPFARKALFTLAFCFLCASQAVAQQRCGLNQSGGPPTEDTSGLSTLEFDRKLELVIHFQPGSADIPADCTFKLNGIVQGVKDGNTGGLLIRSSTSTGASSELDLAIASSRLEAVAQFFRDNRLARRAMTLELHPETTSPPLSPSVDTPRVVEIYSSPAN